MSSRIYSLSSYLDTNIPLLQFVQLEYHGYIRTYKVYYEVKKQPKLELIYLRKNTVHNLINFIKRAIKKDVADTENVSTINFLLDDKMRILLKSKYLYKTDDMHPVYKIIAGTRIKLTTKQYLLD